MKSIYIISIILIFTSVSCIQTPMVERNAYNSEKARRLYSDTTVIFIAKEYSFYRTFEDYSIKNPNVFEGVYYKYDYSTRKRRWNGIKDLFQKLSEIYIFINEAWIQGKSSSCIDPKTGRAYYMAVESMLYIGLNEEHEYLEDIGFKLTGGLNFTCPYSIMHYKRKSIN